MSRRTLIVWMALLGTLCAGHEFALRTLLEYEVAGALLSTGGDPDLMVLAAAVLLLRLVTFVSVAGLGVVLVHQCTTSWSLASRKRASASLGPQDNAAR